MIFIINESGEKVSLKADVVDTNVVLSAIIGERELMLLYADKDECGSAILDRFEKGELIRNEMSRHTVKVDGAYILYDKGFDLKENEEPTGFEGVVKMIAVPKGEPMPKRYTTSKDIIVVIHSTDDVFWMKSEHLLFSDKPTHVVDEQSTVQASIFPIKWYNWSKLKEKTYIYKGIVDEEEKSEKCYRLGYKSGKVEDSTINIVKALYRNKK